MGGSIPARLEPLELRDSRRVALLHPPPPPHALQPQRRQGQGPGTMPAMQEFSACCPSRCSATRSRRCSVLKHPGCSFLSLIVSSRRTCGNEDANSRGFSFGGFMTASNWNYSSWSSVCSRAQTMMIASASIPSSAAHQCLIHEPCTPCAQ